MKSLSSPFASDLAMQFSSATAILIVAVITLIVWVEVAPAWRSPTRHLLLPVAGILGIAAFFSFLK